MFALYGLCYHVLEHSYRRQFESKLYYIGFTVQKPWEEPRHHALPGTPIPICQKLEETLMYASTLCLSSTNQAWHSISCYCYVISPQPGSSPMLARQPYQLNDLSTLHSHPSRLTNHSSCYNRDKGCCA